MAFQALRMIFASSMIIFWWIARGLKRQGAPATQADALLLGHVPPLKQQCSRHQRCLSTGAAEESVTIIPAILPLSHSFSSSNSITATESSYHRNQLTHATSSACTEVLLQRRRRRDLVQTSRRSSETSLHAVFG